MSYTHLTVISSSLCNLNCSFCYLNKNKGFELFNIKNREAWKNHNYLINTYKALYKIQSDPNDIKQICLWGGEPLLFLQDIIENIPEFYGYFPNINYWWTSTNFNINIEDFVNLLIAIDKYYNKKDDKLTFALQLSIDGLEQQFNEQGHNLSKDFYYTQSNKLFNLLNQTHFNNLHLLISLKPTINEQLFLNYFNNDENIITYISNMEKFFLYLNQLNFNKSIVLQPLTIFPTPSLPTEATVNDGLIYGTIVRRFDYLKKQYFASKYENTNFFKNILREDQKIIYTSNIECEENKHAITILYDGTIVECGATFLLGQEEYQQYLNKNSNEFITAKQSSIINYNPLKMNTEQIKKQQWLINGGFKNTSLIYNNLAVGMCIELAKAGQIPEYYLYDQDLLLKHLDIININLICTRDNSKTTCSPFMPSPSVFKKFLNGATEYIYTNNLIKENMEFNKYDDEL